MVEKTKKKQINKIVSNENIEKEIGIDYLWSEMAFKEVTFELDPRMMTALQRSQ